MAVLTVTDLRKSYGGLPAVDGVSFELRPGRLVGLIGPNGSGKSTTINVVSGVDRADGGSVTLDGVDVTNLPAHRLGRLGIARGFQVPRIWHRLSVMENMLVAGTPYDRDGVLAAFQSRGRKRRAMEGIEARARDLLARFLLLDHVNRPAEVLSGGQRRLLDVARILIADAPVVLLDEPLAGVNPVMAETVQNAVLALREAGRSVLVVEHNLAAIEAVSDHTLVMAGGRILAEGSLAEIRGNSEVVAAYLGGEAISA
jgi:branched-chain amino acid transport system ATP-binding protein